MTDQQIEQAYKNVYEDIIAWEEEIALHNIRFIKALGEQAEKDFKELVCDCIVTDKVEFADLPMGMDQQEDCGIFKNVHVKQWTTNMEGDSYSGFIYAQVNDRWIKVPYSC